jgi:two-component system, cell cycle response regulator
MKILVAEDDSISRVLLERTSQRAGYEVTAVEDEAKAITELSKGDSPRMALLDWIMPEKDGVEVCREVRRLKGHAYTYLVLLSSRETKQDIVQGLESGADDYLTKPFDTDELKARLRVGQRILDLEDRLVEARESMRFQATHDRLTSLWNRGVIVVTRELARSRREKNCTVVMMCDIDHFKSVNDRFGHAAGDDVQREVARRLQNSVRSYDIVGRYGGEEFLMVLNNCDPAGAVARAENLQAMVSGKPIPALDQSLTITISVGLAISIDYPNQDVEEIIHQADLALYAAKSGARNCVRVANPDSVAKSETAPKGQVQPANTAVLTS